MPKVTRKAAGSGGAKRGKPSQAKKSAGRNSRRASARPNLLTRLRNLISARLRAAHYRAHNAARLVSAICLVLIAGGLLVLLSFGRLVAMADYTTTAAADGLRKAGFALEAVDVAGASHAEADAIRAALDLNWHDSIFALDLEAARARVEALDWVDQAAVIRLLPNRVQVVVSEQTPLARWQIDGDILVIDIHGERIDQAAPGEYAELPLVVGEGAASAAPSLLAALDRFPLIGGRVEAAQRVGDRRWTLFVDTGAQIYLPEDNDDAALALLSDLQQRRALLDARAASIDLRNPDKLVISPAAEEPEGREA